MGGAQALQIGLDHRALFSTIGLFGAGMTRADFETRFKSAVPALVAPRTRPTLFFIGVAREDPAHDKARELSQLLSSQGVPVTYREVEGGHTYPVWRKLLVETAPLLFRPR
jgi:enterochelin esterase-like enzyme